MFRENLWQVKDDYIIGEKLWGGCVIQVTVLVESQSMVACSKVTCVSHHCDRNHLGCCALL